MTPAEDEALDYVAAIITHDRCGVEPCEDCRVRDWLVNAVRARVWFSDRHYPVGIAQRFASPNCGV